MTARANQAQAGEGLACCGNEQHKMPLAHPRRSNLVRLPRWIASCIAALVLTSAAGGARASCPIALRGDPAIATQIQAELEQFADDGAACVALEITCGAGNGGLTIELDDELGGHALRTFDSAGGASAFLISWSRRPAASSLTRPGVVARVLERSTATPLATAAATWRGELHAAYIKVPSNYALGVGGALVRHQGIVRAGFAARAMTSPSAYAYDEYFSEYYSNVTRITYIGGQVEGTLGVEGHVGFDGHPKWIGLRAELAAGGSMITRLTDTGDLALSSAGPHGAARLAAVWGIGGGIQLEFGLGFELEWQTSRNYKSPLGDSGVQPYPHLDIGLGWAP